MLSLVSYQMGSGIRLSEIKSICLALGKLSTFYPLYKDDNSKCLTVGWEN